MKKTALVITALFATGVGLVVGCGGDDSSTPTPAGDASPEGSANEAGADTSVADTSIADTFVADTSTNDGGTNDASNDGSSDAAPDAFVGDAGCDPVSNPWHYTVDPVNGSDAVSSTGSGTMANNANPLCAFKTITHALTAVLAANNPPIAGTQIIVVGASTVSAGETFPITLPKNVLVTSKGGVVTVNVPANKAGFIIKDVGGGLDTLTIDGQKQTATNGVQVTTGADTTVVINAVIIQNFGAEGMTITGNKSSISINDGSQFLGNKTAGVRIGDSASAAITGKSTQILFKGNGTNGLEVGGTGWATIKASLGNSPPSTATVLFDSNTVAGVVVQQTPGMGAPAVDVSGIAAVKTGANGIGDGATIYGGSAFKLRGSYMLANAANGISLVPGQNTTDYSSVDLGISSMDYGLNLLQDGTNLGAGLCVNFSMSLSQTVHALGNNFGKGLDCSTTAAVLTHGNCKVGNKDTVGVQGNFNQNTVNVSKCTLN